MFDNYKSRIESYGRGAAEAMRNQSKGVIDASFVHDPSFVRVKINDQFVDAKYFMHSHKTLSSGEVDYMLQFRPGVHFQVGTYVDIPDDMDNYNRWLIVMRDDQKIFPLYYVLKCNWTIVWKCNGKFYNCLGLRRFRNSYTSGVWSGDVSTSLDNQSEIWIPSTPETMTINFNQNIIMNNNPLHPQEWEITKITDNLPVGVVKLTLTQKSYDEQDNAELALMTYKINNIDTSNFSELKPQDSVRCAINFAGTLPKLKMGGSYKTFTAIFFSDQGATDSNANPTWDIVLPTGHEDCFSVVIDGYIAKVKCVSYYDLTESNIINIKVHDENNTRSASIDVEVYS